MKTAYFNCSSGVSGDMMIASLMDAFCVSSVVFERRLKCLLKFNAFKLKYGVSRKYHTPVKHLDVLASTHFEGPRQIHRLILGSALPENVKGRSQEMLALLVDAEARVHKVKKQNVHFHELNSVDTLVDITAPLLLLHDYCISNVSSSPLNLGNPAPATLEIVRKCSVPVYSSLPTHELTTPTGSALMSTIAGNFGAMPLMKVSACGTACGAMDIAGHHNVLKVFIGSLLNAPSRYDSDEVVSLETNIDDMDPRIYPYVMEKILGAGALDVWLVNVLMKKGRPGIILCALVVPTNEQCIVDILFRETTTLGIRRNLIARHILMRKIDRQKKTSFSITNGNRTRIEYEAAKKLAIRGNLPLRDIID